MKIIKANYGNLEEIVPLFDAYRVFYKQKPDLEGAFEYLKARFNRNESVIFLAFDGDEAVGFTQLYPMFSSVSMKPAYVLNDLFVKAKVRGKGFGAALLKTAEDFAKENNLKGLTLETAKDNPAQKLYEKNGLDKGGGLALLYRSVEE